MRIGIIGGGIAGLTTAWLLHESHDVVVFEARPGPGGHADSVLVTLPDREVTVDLGAQYVSREGFPLHGRLIDLLGLPDEVLAPVPVTTTITAGSPVPLLVTPHRPDEARGVRIAVGGAHLDAIGLFMEAAIAFEAANGDWETPLADLVEPLPLSRGDKDDFLYPWLSHIVCCANRDAPHVSARAAIAFFVRLAPPAPDEATVWANPTCGLSEIVDGLLIQLSPENLRRNAPIVRVRRIGQEWHVDDHHEHRTIVDRLVLAAPPHATLPLLTTVDGTGEARRALGAFTFTTATVAIHLDPTYMPADPRHWSTVCLDIHDGWTEASHWYGALHRADVFKSWITYRSNLPTSVVARRTFQHLVVTPAAVRARAALAALQGADGLYFAGSYMTYFDSQESAVMSAVSVAQRLAPGSANLAALTSTAPPGAAPP